MPLQLACYFLLVVTCLSLNSAEIWAQDEQISSPPAGTTRVQGRSGFFERLPPREKKTPEQLLSWTQELRALYHQSPENWPKPTLDEGVTFKELGLLPEMIHPEDNPFDKAKVALGRQLFFDPRLSKSGEMACASCHDPDLSWADGRTVSFGLVRKELNRNSPSLLNVGHYQTLFWDGRAGSLEDQAEQVLENPHEMGSSDQIIIDRIGEIAEYQDIFTNVFGEGGVTRERVAKALACFERTLVGGRSSFDNFLRGKHEQLSDSAVRGLDLFRRDARCINCHNGPLFTDNQFHDVGLSYYGRTYQDLGRFEITGDTKDVGKFRTPSLRNISNTGPYMHNGLFPLAGVLRMYNAGMPTLTPKNDEQKADPNFPHQKSPHLRPLGLNDQDLDDLQAFLESLAEPRLRHRPPALPSFANRFSTQETTTDQP